MSENLTDNWFDAWVKEHLKDANPAQTENAKLIYMSGWRDCFEVMAFRIGSLSEDLAEEAISQVHQEINSFWVSAQFKNILQHMVKPEGKPN